LPNTSRCFALLEKIKKLEKATKPDQNKIQALKDELYHEEARLPLHNGKAIVVFDSLRKRSVVLKLFRRSRTHFLEVVFRGYNTQTVFKNSYLKAKALPEPQNLNYEVLYYPKCKKYSRIILAFASGSIILLVITVMTVFVTYIG